MQYSLDVAFSSNSPKIMAMEPSGTFDYGAVVPEARMEGGFECRAETCGTIVHTVSRLTDARLVGISPEVRITDAGPPNDPGLRPPWSLRKRSRITLLATTKDQASVAEASFYIDKTFTDCAKAGDQMHLSRNLRWRSRFLAYSGR